MRSLRDLKKKSELGMAMWTLLIFPLLPKALLSAPLRTILSPGRCLLPILHPQHTQTHTHTPPMLNGLFFKFTPSSSLQFLQKTFSLSPLCLEKLIAPIDKHLKSAHERKMNSLFMAGTVPGALHMLHYLILLQNIRR